MRRIGIILAVLLVLILLFLILTVSSSPSLNPPQFVPSRSQPTGPYTRMYYDYGGVVTVRDGKIWFWTVTGSNRTNMHIQHFLYDLDRRLVIGELLHGNPLFSNRDGTRLLCEGYGSLATSFKAKTLLWLQSFSFGKALGQRMNRDQDFWVLDLKDNSSVRIGGFSQLAGTGSSFIPAPGFRYAYNKPTTSFGTAGLFLCDLETKKLTKISIDGWPEGWWDGQNILFKDPLNNFGLYDAATKKTRTLFTTASISSSLQQLDLAADPAALMAFCHWNGGAYDAYFTQESEKNWGESFLLKADRADSTLKLLYRSFKFRWSGVLDADATHYLYSGESGPPGKGGNGGVFIRDLVSNTTRTLVEPDNGGQYSLCRFCGDGVIYWRNRLLWRVDLNGSNNAPLLPIPYK